MVRPGRDYRLEAYARFGPPRGLDDIVVPFVSLARAHIALPSLGTVLIDPRQAVSLPSFLIPAAVGRGESSVPVPNKASLVGTRWHAQAFVVQQGSRVRLTNVVSDVVIK